ALGMLLPDHIIVQHLADIARRGHPVGGLQPGGLRLLADDVHAQFDTFITDEHGRSRNKLAHLVLALAAERAVKRVLAAVRAGIVRHRLPLHWPGPRPGPLMSCPEPKTRTAPL